MILIIFRENKSNRIFWKTINKTRLVLSLDRDDLLIRKTKFWYEEIIRFKINIKIIFGKIRIFERKEQGVLDVKTRYIELLAETCLGINWTAVQFVFNWKRIILLNDTEARKG